MALFKPGKKYGLIMNNKKQAEMRGETGTRVNPLQGSNMKKASIFGADSSDSDNEGAGGSDWVAKSLKVKANNSGLKKQSKIQMSKALEEDPTVFQYDEVYDDIEKKKVEEKESKKEVDRKPKYVHNLLKAADERQKEFERRIERQVQKEREAEGEMYADKESFVTSSYRKKMEEIAEQEEEEARKARIEAALDVTKQNNLDGFYRHLYRQTMGEEKEQVEARKKEEKPEETEEERAARVKEEIKKIKIKEDETEDDVPQEATTAIKKIDKNKGFRKKEVVESSSEDDSSSGESDDEDQKDDNPGKDVQMSAEEKFEKRKEELRLQREKREKRKRKIEDDASSSESEDETEQKKAREAETLKDDSKDEDNDDVVVVKEEDTKPKINIWEKRTVGEVLEEAQKRYWERRAVRESG